MENFASYIGKAISEHPFISAYVVSGVAAQIGKTLRYGLYIHGFRRYGKNVNPCEEESTVTSEVAKKIEEKADEKLKEMKAAACDVAEDEDELEEESDEPEDEENEDDGLGSVSDGKDKIAVFESGSSLLKD